MKDHFLKYEAVILHVLCLVFPLLTILTITFILIPLQIHDDFSREVGYILLVFDSVIILGSVLTLKHWYLKTQIDSQGISSTWFHQSIQQIPWNQIENIQVFYFYRMGYQFSVHSPSQKDFRFFITFRSKAVLRALISYCPNEELKLRLILQHRRIKYYYNQHQLYHAVETNDVEKTLHLIGCLEEHIQFALHYKEVHGEEAYQMVVKDIIRFGFII
ncbi:MAG: hypothetical protein PHP32_00475 [Candidatus Izemoplasmatales bacterium]|nr:hypothetical protein [Candidatus Izemoplasmatales bacterium]